MLSLRDLNIEARTVPATQWLEETGTVPDDDGDSPRDDDDGDSPRDGGCSTQGTVPVLTGVK